MYDNTIARDIVNVRALLDAALTQLKAREPRLLTAEDFENNPDIDPQGYLPCWVECGPKEIAMAVREGLVEPGEDVDGWTAASAADMPGGKYYNPNVRYWTSRPTDARRAAVPWPDTASPKEMGK